MIILLALRRLIPLLAVLSIALVPAVAPAATASMHGAPVGHAAVGHHQGMHAMGMEHGGMVMADGSMAEIPCCPNGQSVPNDCGKGCPLMTLCLSTIATLLPTTLAMDAPVGARRMPVWPATASLASASLSPLPEPPRA